MTRASAAELAQRDPHNCDHMFDPDVILSQKDVRYKSREKMILMKIDDYLLMALHTNGSSTKSERVESMIEVGEKFNAVPYLAFYRQEGGFQQVEGHEGRHRALALKKLGFISMPVILKCDIRWSEQTNPERFDYQEEWPTKLHSENGASITIDFPVRREDCDRSYQTLLSEQEPGLIATPKAVKMRP